MSTRSYLLLVVLGIVLLGGAFWMGGFSFDVSRFFAAEESTPRETIEASPSREPVAWTGFCEPGIQNVVVGVSAQLRARSATAQWFAPEGTPSEGTGTSFAVAYATTGTKQVTVQVPRTDGSLGIDSSACTVVVNP